MEKTAAKAAENVYLARIAKPRLQKTLVGNGNLRKLHRGPQHSCLLGAEQAGSLDRDYLTDGHSLRTSLHPVHLTCGRHCRHGGPQKDFINRSNLACHHRDRTGDSVDGASAQPLPHSGKARSFSARVSHLAPLPTLRLSLRWFPRKIWPLHILSPDYRWMFRGLSGRCFQRSCFRWPEQASSLALTGLVSS